MSPLPQPGSLNPRVHGFRPLVQSPDAAPGLHPVTRAASVRSNQPFRRLPAPTGAAPYHLDLADLLPAGHMDAIRQAGRLVFHMVGDTGGIKTPVPQTNVARRMLQDFTGDDLAAQPAVFYHLGDVVYFYGESASYFDQFYEPYENYPGVIVAIPGNHDGDLSPAMLDQHVSSLAAFDTNFCAPHPYHSPDAGDAARLAMTQPNVYWTLTTPFVTIVGLYTNVPEGGQMDDTQIAWLQQEIAAVPKGQGLLLTMHHPIYSLDTFHSGSAYMHNVLEETTQAAGRLPDAVFSGHVHNYQRFTRHWSGKDVPFVVAGAGGYHNLHHLASGVQEGSNPSPTDDVTFERGNDTQFGYLRLEVTPAGLKGDYFAVPGFVDPHDPATLPADGPYDTFSLSF